MDPPQRHRPDTWPEHEDPVSHTDEKKREGERETERGRDRERERQREREKERKESY